MYLPMAMERQAAFSSIQPSAFTHTLTPHPGFNHPHPAAAHIYPAGYFIATNAAAVATFQLAAAGYPAAMPFDRLPGPSWHEHIYKSAPKTTPYSIEDILGEQRKKDARDRCKSPETDISSVYRHTPPRLGPPRDAPRDVSPPRYQSTPRSMRDVSPEKSSHFTKKSSSPTLEYSPNVSHRDRGYLSGNSGVLDLTTAHCYTGRCSFTIST